MSVKIFMKFICIFAFGLSGVFVVASYPAFAQQLLQDPGYGLHMQGMKKRKKDKKESESGLEFSAADLARWGIVQVRSKDRYEERVKQIISGKRSMDDSVRSLRILYSDTPYYQPFGQRVVDKMAAFAYTADVSDDQGEVNDALNDYREMLYKHIANIDVIYYALMLARANPVYGDRILLQEVMDAILKDMAVLGRDGDSPADAFRVVTYGEKLYITGEKGVNVDACEIYKVEDRFFDVCDVTYPDNIFSRLYFDVTWPIYKYEKTQALLEKERESVVSIPAQ